MKNLCVYCGSSNRIHSIFQDVAKELGELIAKNGYRLVYGGGRLGLMGTIASSVVNSGGYAIGYMPTILQEREEGHPDIQELYIVENMHARKAAMSNQADCFIILPGGFGTLDEFFDIFTLRQLDAHQKPIFILNVQGYWDPLLALMDSIFFHKFAKVEHKNIATVVSSAQEIFSYL